MEHYGYGEQDVIICECGECNRIANSVHHLVPRSQGGGDNIENLIGLTMECHDRAERGKDRKEFNDKLKAIKKAEFVSQCTL